MPKLAVRPLARSVAIALLLGAVSPPAVAGQPPPNFGGVLGAILNSALANQARQEWQNRPIADYSCLEAHNLSADRLAADGISPNDPRVQKIFAQCADEAAIRAKAAISPVVASHNHEFVVDGLAVGAAVHPDSPVYKAYKCRPSDEFPGFTWCAIKHPMTGKFGPYDSWTTILHSDANIAVFILQDVIPAYFSPGDAEREIDRLSQYFGQAARVLTGDSRADAPHSVIAAWGDVTLTPLDEPTMEVLRRGETITAGLVIDFLADSRKSAREGLPVFRMGGGAGYIWAAKFDDTGKGRLRITAVNPGLLPAGPVEQPPPIPDVPPPSPTPAPTTQDPAQIEKDRAARAERAIAAADQQLDDAAAFIKEHSESPNLLEYVDQITALKAAVKNGDPDEIERKSKELADAFSHDMDYQQHLAEVIEAQKKRDAQFLLDAIHRGQKERDFILDYIGKNPLADATPALAALVKQLNPALQRAELNQLQPMVDKIDVAIREANLESAFVSSQKEVNNSQEKKAVTTPTVIPNAPPVVKLPTTEKNRFLVEGDLDDVEILYNASSKAPHVAQNLRGDFVFSQNEARICLFGQNPDGLALTAKQVVSAKANARQIAVTVEPCNAEQLLSYDIVATQRNAFLRSKRDDALALIQTIEDGDYRKFAEVTAADLNKSTDAEHAQIEKNKANIADGAPEGFGVVLLKTGSANLCLAVEKAEVPSHEQLLLRAEDKLNLEMQTAVVIKDTTIDDAFINIQKRQCGGVYASAADLKTLTAALARDDIPYAALLGARPLASTLAPMRPATARRSAAPPAATASKASSLSASTGPISQATAAPGQNEMPQPRRIRRRRLVRPRRVKTLSRIASARLSQRRWASSLRRPGRNRHVGEDARQVARASRAARGQNLPARRPAAARDALRQSPRAVARPLGSTRSRRRDHLSHLGRRRVAPSHRLCRPTRRQAPARGAARTAGLIAEQHSANASVHAIVSRVSIRAGVCWRRVSVPLPCFLFARVRRSMTGSNPKGTTHDIVSTHRGTR